MGVSSGLITAITADSAQLATDTASLLALQAKVEADTSAGAQADAALSAALQSDGPTAVVNSDGSVNGYQFSSTPPGYTITVYSPPSA